MWVMVNFFANFFRKVFYPDPRGAAILKITLRDRLSQRVTLLLKYGGRLPAEFT